MRSEGYGTVCVCVCVCVCVSVSTLVPASLVYTWKIRCAKFYFSLFLDFSSWIVQKLLREKANMLMSTCLPRQRPVLLQQLLAQCFDDRGF